MLEVIEIEKGSLFREFRQRLDIGESAALSYAIRNDADLILIDEKEGRNAARNHDLNMTGVIGILVKADHKNKIDLEKQIDRLREEGFWISEDLYQKILKQKS